MRFRSVSAAVALLSAGSVAYEILLVRIFAIQYFHHFAYMAVGVAMLGTGVAGTVLAVVGRSRRFANARGFAAVAAATAVTLTISPLLALSIPLDPTQLTADAWQWVRLGGLYVILALPFGTGALATVLALAMKGQLRGQVYGASFGGAGAGAVVALLAGTIVFPDRALAVPAVIAAAGAVVSLAGITLRGWGREALGGLLVGLGLVAVVKPPWTVRVNQYKGLPQIEAFPGARRVTEDTHPLGWVVSVSAEAFRYAPGLSLGFRGSFPRQTALFVDGELVGAARRDEPEDPGGDVLYDWLPSALPYQLYAEPRVLVIEAGGDTEVRNAVAHGAREVTAVELHPGIVRLVATAADRDNGVRWLAGDARAYVARSRERYDIVTVGPTGGPGGAVGGIHALTEDFLHTVPAYDGYLDRLSDSGLLSVTRWLAIPPRSSIRVILSAGEAMRRVAPAAVERGLVVARSWGTVTVLAKPSGFTPAEIEALRAWTEPRGIDLDWHPGMQAPVTGHNVLDEPTPYRAARAAVSGADSVARFVAGYPFDVGPLSDRRPYPHHFIRAASLRSLLDDSWSTFLPFAEWGYIALAATLVQSIVVAAVFLFGPLILGRQWRLGRGGGRLIGYFGSIGLGYMAAEIAAIQQLTLLLGHPVYAVTAVIAVMLIGSGAGSMWSDRRSPGDAFGATSVVSGCFVVYAVSLLAVVHGVQGAPLAVRAVVSVTLLGPVAFAMGMPFPLGLRAFAPRKTSRLAWAWAVNGFASVVAAPLAALVAVEFGSPAVFAVASAAYLMAALLSRHGSVVPVSTASRGTSRRVPASPAAG